MDLISLERQMAEKRQDAEAMIQNGLAEYSRCRLVTAVAELIKDAWEEVGFETDATEYKFYGSGTGKGQLSVKDYQLEPLTPEDFDSLSDTIADLFDSAGDLDRWAAIDIWRSGADGMVVEIKALHPMTQAKEFYEYWQGISSGAL